MAAYRFTRTLALFAIFALLACSDAEPHEPDELPEQVAVVIGAKGGRVAAKGVTLEIPPGALDKELTITVKKTDKAVAPAVKKLSSVYEFGPEGTAFTKDVKVAFDLEKPEAKAVVYFTKKGSSVEFEELPTTRTEKQVSAVVNHFSLGFAGLPAGDDLPELDASTGEDIDAGTDDLDATVMLPDTSVDASAEPDAGPMPAGQRITVLSIDGYGRPANQTWAAYRDGDGAWQALSPTGQGEYQFDVQEGTYAVAFVCGDGDAGSEGVVLLAPATRTTQQVEASGLCVTERTQYTLSGTISAVDAAFAWGHPFASGLDVLAVGGPPPTYSITNIPDDVAIDPVVAVLDGNSFISKALILRGLTLQSNMTLDIDLVNQGHTAQTAQFSVTDANAETQLTVHLATRNANQGLSVGWGIVGGSTTRTLQYQYLNGATLNPADNYVFTAKSETPNVRWARLRTKTTGTVQFAFPADFTASFERGGSTHVLPKMQFDSLPEAAFYQLTVGDIEGPTHLFSVKADAAWLAAQGAPADGLYEHELTLPDLTSAPGFDPNWLHPSSSTVRFTGAVLRSENAQGGVLESYSTYSETSSIIPL